MFIILDVFYSVLMLVILNHCSLFPLNSFYVMSVIFGAAIELVAIH